jgi:hypothetical protein
MYVCLFGLGVHFMSLFTSLNITSVCQSCQQNARFLLKKNLFVHAAGVWSFFVLLVSQISPQARVCLHFTSQPRQSSFGLFVSCCRAFNSSKSDHAFIRSSVSVTHQPVSWFCSCQSFALSSSTFLFPKHHLRYHTSLLCMYVKGQGSICRNFLPDLSFSLLVECIIFVRRDIQSSQIFLVNLWSHERNEMCCSSRNFVGYF